MRHILDSRIANAAWVFRRFEGLNKGRQTKADQGETVRGVMWMRVAMAAPDIGGPDHQLHQRVRLVCAFSRGGELWFVLADGSGQPSTATNAKPYNLFWPSLILCVHGRTFGSAGTLFLGVSEFPENKKPCNLLGYRAIP
jgi:hypothetical protein